MGGVGLSGFSSGDGKEAILRDSVPGQGCGVSEEQDKEQHKGGSERGQSMLLSGGLRLKSLVKSLRKMVIILCSHLEIDHGVMYWGGGK